MPYLIRWTGLYQDAERGHNVRRSHYSLCICGNVRIYPTRAEAQAAADIEDDSSGYDGVLSHNVLSHGQISGEAPRVSYVSRYPSHQPLAVRYQGTCCGDCREAKAHAESSRW